MTVALCGWLFATYAYICVLDLIYSASADPTFTPILPPSYPLAVRNPYLSAWIPGVEVTKLPTTAPEFWNGQKLNWSVIARVDSTAYSLFGVVSPVDGVEAGHVLAAEYTSTHSIFTVSAGSATFKLDFFSPVSPKNHLRQSLPFSYLTVSASEQPGKTPSVQIYSDIDDSWTGHFEDGAQIDWTYGTGTFNTQVISLTPASGHIYGEVSDFAQWGSEVYCARPGTTNLTSLVGDLPTLRSDFSRAGAAFDRAWSWEPGSGIAYRHNLGAIRSTTNVTFVVGYVRNPDVNYLGDARRGYWASECSGDDYIVCGCSNAFEDFEDANAESHTFDAIIASRAGDAGGTNYRDIVALSARQTFGAMDLTIPADKLNTDDLLVFQKEISSNGNVNTVDVIFPVSPVMYVLAPEWIRLLTEPVMRYLATGRWNVNFTIHDIGDHYPNATGHDNGFAEPMPLEEGGKIILLAYMYEKSTGNAEWAVQYSPLFQLYADYLVAHGLYPELQLSSDDGAGGIENQTSLAVKSAVALNAYGIMTNQQNYSDVRLQFANTLYNEGAGLDLPRTHFTLVQGNDSTWTTGYNLYMDVLLKLNTFPPEAYAMQNAFYQIGRQEAGVPLDDRVQWGKTDWTIFAAAAATADNTTQVGGREVRDMFVNDVHACTTNGKNGVPYGIDSSRSTT